MLIKLRDRFVKLLFWAVTCIIGASCATVHQDEADIRHAVLKEDEGIVFFGVSARVHNSTDNKPRGGETPKVDYSLSYVAASKFFGGFGIIDGDTRTSETLFVRRLPAGDYTMNKLHASIGVLSASTDIDVRFTVLPKKATYLGILQLEFSDKKGTAGQASSAQALVLKVADDRDNTINLFKARNPGLAYEVTTSLMQLTR